MSAKRMDGKSKQIPEALVRSLKSLHEGTKSRFRVDSQLDVIAGSVLSHFHFEVVADVTELARGVYNVSCCMLMI